MKLTDVILYAIEYRLAEPTKKSIRQRTSYSCQAVYDALWARHHYGLMSVKEYETLLKLFDDLYYELQVGDYPMVCLGYDYSYIQTKEAYQVRLMWLAFMYTIAEERNI